MGVGGRVVAGLVIALTAGCEGRTELVVRVTSDLPIGTSAGAIARAEVHVATRVGATPARRRCACQIDACEGQDVSATFPLTFSLEPGRQGEDPFPTTVRAGATPTCGADLGEISTTARMRFVRGQRRLVRLELTRACLGVACVDGETCDPRTGVCTAVPEAPLEPLPTGADLADPAVDASGAVDLAGFDLLGADLLASSPVDVPTVIDARPVGGAPSLSLPSVASDGSDVVVVYGDGATLRSVRVDPAGFASRGPDFATWPQLDRPVIGWAAGRYLVAWSTGTGITLRTLPPQLAGSPLETRIFGGNQDQRQLVAASGPTRVAVAWAELTGVGMQIPLLLADPQSLATASLQPVNAGGSTGSQIGIGLSVERQPIERYSAMAAIDGFVLAGLRFEADFSGSFPIFGQTATANASLAFAQPDVGARWESQFEAASLGIVLRNGTMVAVHGLSSGSYSGHATGADGTQIAIAAGDGGAIVYRQLDTTTGILAPLVSRPSTLAGAIVIGPALAHRSDHRWLIAWREDTAMEQRIVVWRAP